MSKRPDPDIQVIVAWLRDLRRTSGLTQSDVADAGKITRRTVINIEQGQRVPHARSLAGYVRGMGYKLTVISR